MKPHLILLAILVACSNDPATNPTTDAGTSPDATTAPDSTIPTPDATITPDAKQAPLDAMLSQPDAQVQAFVWDGTYVVAALNGTVANLDPSWNCGAPATYGFDRLTITGNTGVYFYSVGGATPRMNVTVTNRTGSTATISGWDTVGPCNAMAVDADGFGCHVVRTDLRCRYEWDVGFGRI